MFPGWLFSTGEGVFSLGHIFSAVSIFRSGIFRGGVFSGEGGICFVFLGGGVKC